MARFQAPEELRDSFTDDEWSEHIACRVRRFDMQPLRRRLDFVRDFAMEFDWTNVAFSALLERAELDAIASTFRAALLRHVDRARAQLDAGDTELAHASLLQLMRASPLGGHADTTTTQFGDVSARSLPLLGDIIAREWARVCPDAEHVRACAQVARMARELPPSMVARAVLEHVAEM